MEFLIDTQLVILILSACFVIGLLLMLIPLHTWRRTASFPTSEPTQTTPPKLSVVLYSEGHEEEILDCVTRLSTQDYPDYELIIVCRATMESRNILAARLTEFPNVYVTFIPQGSHNLSERKLAITIGLKAAKGDIVLTTTTNIVPGSEHWFSEIAAPFSNPRIELVLGYSNIDINEMKGPSKWYRQFDSVVNATQWIAYAADGKAYRGDGYNMAFRRDTFFRHKGFAKTINLHYGDDDLFIHELATPCNTAVVVNENSNITTIWGNMANKIWKLRKERYLFTSRWLPDGPFVMMGFLSFLNWLVSLTCLGLIVILSLSIAVIEPDFATSYKADLTEKCVFLGVTVLLYLWMQIWMIRLYRKISRRLDAVQLRLSVPLFLLIHPFLNCLFRINHNHRRKSVYTWRR